MKINYYKSYIDSIKGSVGSQSRRHFWIKKNEKNIDICQNGNLSCAYFVSNLLKQYNLIDSGSVNTNSTITKLITKGRQCIDPKTEAIDIPIGSVLIWRGGYGKDGYHNHIGFYLGNELAVSNDSYQSDRSGLDYVEPQYCPIKHHYKYRGSRDIDQIYIYDFKTKIDWLFHEELEVKIYGQTERYIYDHGLSDEEINRSLGKNDNLKNGRICGLSIVLSAINYYKKLDKRYSDLINFRHLNYSFVHPITGDKIIRNNWSKNSGRAHGGLLDLADKFGIKGNTYINDLNDMSSSKIINLILQNIKENKITVFSADLDIGIGEFRGKKGGHLIMILGLDYNGYEYSILIGNPLQPQNIHKVGISRFMQGFGGKGIILYI